MNTVIAENHTAPPSGSRALILLLGLAVGVIAANLYYAQPLIALISQSLGLDPAAAGLIVTLTQVGYGLGVLFIVPLGDLIENRKLILILMVIAVLALLGLALSTQIVPYFLAALATGIGACSVQIIVPYAAHLTPEATRGRVVGSLMSGLMLGIMLSRPIASLLTDLFSWHAVFYLSASLMVLLGAALYKFLPPRQPANLDLRYADLIGSMAQLFLRTSLLRRRAFYQAFMFAAFCLFWTATPLLLSGPEFHLSQTGIALFALAGVAGAIVAPLAGRFADRGWTRIGTFASMLSGCVAFLMTHLVPLGSVSSLALLVLSAILLDAGVTANLVLGQRAIFSLRAKYRSRLNGLYIATIFVGGAFGSSVGAWAYAKGGWNLTSWVGFAMPLGALLYFGTEWRK
jgi:predicted MFS family arabinose efflux permease